MKWFKFFFSLLPVVNDYLSLVEDVIRKVKAVKFSPGVSGE